MQKYISPLAGVIPLSWTFVLEKSLSSPPISREVSVPTEVMAGCAAVVTVAAVPETFPVSGPEKPVAVSGEKRPTEFFRSRRGG